MNDTGRNRSHGQARLSGFSNSGQTIATQRLSASCQKATFAPQQAAQKERPPVRRSFGATSKKIIRLS